MAKKKNFDQRLGNIPDNLWSVITQIDQLQGQWIAGAKLSPQVLGRLKKSVLVTSTGASTRIEGARLSDEDIEKMMRGISIQKFTDRDKQEVKGYYELLDNVFISWKSISFNESAIKHFHNELLKYADKDQKHKGDYKKQENKVHMINEADESVGVLFDTTPAYLAPKEMQELVEWTNDALREKKYHPLLIVGNFIVEFLKIHPFQDGNGRISSFLTQSRMAVDLLSQENIEKLLTVKQMAVWQYLQEASETATPKEISQNTKVAQPTVRQALDKLMRLKKIERTGQGRSTAYRVLK